MKARIQKWGNGLAIRIPESLASETHLEQDSEVELSQEDGRLVVEPVGGSYTMAELLRKVTPDNLHGEQEYGPSAGKEVW